MPGDFMVSVNSNRTDETRRWKIPDKFINQDFSTFLDNYFPLEDVGGERDLIRITMGWGSIKEGLDHYQLQENYGITLNAILKLLDDKGCIIEVNRKENYLKYHHQNIEYLRGEIEARIRN